MRVDVDVDSSLEPFDRRLGAVSSTSTAMASEGCAFVVEIMLFYFFILGSVKHAVALQEGKKVLGFAVCRSFLDKNEDSMYMPLGSLGKQEILYKNLSTKWILNSQGRQQESLE